MTDNHVFGADVVRIICDRLASKSADIHLMMETKYSFEEWLNWEAYLACRLHQSSYPFCEVTAKPSYRVANGLDEVSEPNRMLGDLLVGASYDKDDHRWLFAEFALLHDGNSIGGKWLEKIRSDVEKLKQLGWERSAAVLFVVVASRVNVQTDWGRYLTDFAVWNQPVLTKPSELALPNGGSLVIRAFDIKCDPNDTMTWKAPNG